MPVPTNGQIVVCQGAIELLGKQLGVDADEKVCCKACHTPSGDYGYHILPLLQEDVIRRTYKLPIDLGSVPIFGLCCSMFDIITYPYCNAAGITYPEYMDLVQCAVLNGYGQVIRIAPGMPEQLIGAQFL